MPQKANCLKLFNRRFIIDLNTVWKYLCKEKPSDSSMPFSWIDKRITRSSSWNLKLIEMSGSRLFYLPNSVKMCDTFNKAVLEGDQTYFPLQRRHVDQGYKRLLSFLFCTSHWQLLYLSRFLLTENARKVTSTNWSSQLIKYTTRAI